MQAYTQQTHDVYTTSSQRRCNVKTSRHMTSIQRRLNVDATSRRCIDVETTLYRRHVSAGYSLFLSLTKLVSIYRVFCIICLIYNVVCTLEVTRSDFSFFLAYNAIAPLTTTRRFRRRLVLVASSYQKCKLEIKLIKEEKKMARGLL